MPKRLIKINFRNVLNLETFTKEVFDLDGLRDIYDFEESSDPDFIIFGPYGNDVPPPGNYVRIGYFCENIKPDFSNCEWAFGIPAEKDINRPNYKKIQWHNLNPQDLVKPPDFNAGQVFASKTKFCNFLYSHKVPYREAFFTQLSKYKKVDAPGKSMNNMASIDTIIKGDKWNIKRKFLSPYKFTIAFENDVYRGYQTEKLYDAMLELSIPIYCGDPYIGDVFNTKSFVNVPDYLPRKNQSLIDRMEKFGHMDYEDILPSYLKGPKHRIKRKVKSFVRNNKLRIQFSGMDFSPVIDRIIALDQDDEKYIEILKQPWFNNNTPPLEASSRERWIEIFESKR